MQDLAGKTAFVTGAASGIGLGIAGALAQAGVKVMLADIEADTLADAVASLRRTNAAVEGIVADVSLKGDLQAAAEATLVRFGEVHILVNNAGVGGGGVYGGWSDAGWDWVIGVNLMAVIWGVEIFGPLIERHGEGGHIVSTASMAGLMRGTSSPYSVTKHAVVALMEGLRLDLALRGVGVSVLCPGLVNTNIADSARHLPPRFSRAVGASPLAGATEAQLAALREVLAGGADPAAVGELVREAIEQDWPYIFTDLDFEPRVEARFAAIRQGFDRIRGRSLPNRPFNF